MKAQPKLSSADLERGREAALTDLADARAEHAKRAYDHALDRNDEVARQALLKSKQRLDLLEAELVGLSAATGEAQRREQHARLIAEIEAWGAKRKEAIASADQAQAAFERAWAAIAEAGQAVADYEAAERECRTHEGRCCADDSRLYYPAVKASGLIDAMLWLAGLGNRNPQRSEAVMDLAGHPTPDRPKELIARSIERCKDRIEAGVRSRIQVLRDEAATLETP